MTRKLHLAGDFAPPLEAVSEKLAFLGRTGSGKSYAAMKLAEEFARSKAQFVTLDPVGIWWGLRLAADGTSPGIALPILGGLHGDVPLEPTAGALIADLVVDRGISCVLDVSQFESDADKARFAEAWASRFYFRKKASPSAVHIFVEESQEFVPQNPQKGEERMLHAFQRLEKLGRNFGIGVSLISQRPQEVNKKALNQTELLFAFQMTGPQERKAIEGWIAEKGLDEDIAGELPKLARGQPHVWSPAWLSISKTVRIDKRWTYDASSTPKVGASSEAHELAPIDLEELTKRMAQTIERAKAEDPKELRAQIAGLERELKKKAAPSPDPRATQKEIDRAVAAAQRQAEEPYRIARSIGAELEKRVRRVSDELEAIAGQLTGLSHAAPPPQIAAQHLHGSQRSHRSVPAVPTAHRETRSVGAEKVSQPQQRMLDALASFEAIGVDRLNRSHLAVFSNQSPRSSGFERNESVLSTLGLMDRPGPGLRRLTNAGRALSATPESPTTLNELHRAWAAKLSGPQARMLATLIDIYPDSMPRETLAEATSQSVTSSGFERNESILSSLGLMGRLPGTRERVATELLFPEGVR